MEKFENLKKEVEVKIKTSRNKKRINGKGKRKQRQNWRVKTRKRQINRKHLASTCHRLQLQKNHTTKQNYRTGDITCIECFALGFELKSELIANYARKRTNLEKEMKIINIGNTLCRYRICDGTCTSIRDIEGDASGTNSNNITIESKQDKRGN